MFFYDISLFSFKNQEALSMESRDIGIGIVMIIPSFVGSGAVWHLTHGSGPVIRWGLVVLWIIAMICVYGGILKRKYS